MHYIVTTNEENPAIKEYIPITQEMAEDMPNIILDMANVAECYGSHVELNAETGEINIVDGLEVGHEKPLHPTLQIAREVEKNFVYQQYGEKGSDNIKEIDIKSVCPDFKGHLFMFIYLTAEEFQQSIIVLDEKGHYLSSYDELDEKFDPAVEGLNADAKEACKRAFETGVDLYKKELARDVKSKPVVK